jgi:Ca2+-binding RTX toxin-like protein
MAGTLALNVEILGEFKKLTTATQGAENSLKGLQDKVGGFATNITKIVGALGITLGFNALIQGAKDAVFAASDLEQQFGALDSIFKTSADEMQVFSKEMNSIGLSTADAARQSSLIGALLKGNGLTIEDTAEKTQGLVKLAGDLAATFGGPTADAVSAISSLLKGERDPIERYGVSLKALDVDAQMLTDTKNGLVFASENEARVNATLTLLYQKTTDARRQFVFLLYLVF